MGDRRVRKMKPVLLVLALGACCLLVGATPSKGEQQMRLFRINPSNRQVLGPAAHVTGYLSLRLVSVAMDQPEYWPQEQVRVKVVMPGRPRASIQVELRKRDANPSTIGPLTLDAQGVAVVQLLDGRKRRLELGEYRVEVKTVDKKLSGATTFSVVEGSLGALSFAHEFKHIVNPAQLEGVKAGWFLGNAAGAGRRWGNGLSFKNELRLDNTPYSGEIELISRCMLPGCNGCEAGKRQKLRISGGTLAATMDVGGHSGPFQIEVVTPRGNLLYQFEGSGHVEREVVQISQGMHYRYGAGLAPYPGTTQVPGRRVFIERKLDDEKDSFEVESVVATAGELAIRVRKPVDNAVLHVWSAAADGTFQLKPMKLERHLGAGTLLKAPVSMPFSLVAVGGFSGGKFVEGYTLAFVPAGLQIALEAPPSGSPQREIPVAVAVRHVGGGGARVSGILEVFDNRVASKSPSSPLASAIGDSLRRVSSSLSAWVDPLEVAKREREEAKAERARGSAPKKMMQQLPGSVAFAAMPMTSSAQGGGSPAGTELEDEAAEGPMLRRGEEKVVYCERVETDATGRAMVQVKLPPQIGRVALRFVAVEGLDYAEAQREVDVTKRTYLEAQLPNTFVPGARLQLRVTAANATQELLQLAISGAGIAGTLRQSVPPGHQELFVPWEGKAPGTLTMLLTDPRGKTVDRREFSPRDVANQDVTLSRLELADRQTIALAADEAAMVYAGPGPLLKGTVMNMVTTMYSWFGHAEALSAKVAVGAVLLAAIKKGILEDEGLEQTLRVDLEKAARDLEQRFFDRSSGLMRPYPGLAPNPLWSAWASRNFHAALRAAPPVGEALSPCRRMATSIDAALKKQGLKPAELGGYDPDQQGREVIPVEVNGQVLYKAITDDAVVRFAMDRLLPVLDPLRRNSELAFARAYDRYRFLRAFKRTGALQYMIESAKALWLAGPRSRPAFTKLFATVARGLILAQEPGMIQGPALTGGVYSSPMALVRFLELMLLVGKGQAPSGAITVAGQTVPYGAKIAPGKASSLQAPAGAFVRIDRPMRLSLLENYGQPFAKASVSAAQLGVGQEAKLTLQLDASRDPLEYYAIIAVPSTTAVKQTEDILADYKGQLIYGQQARGSAKMQALAVPFRGARTMSLLLEGLLPGTSAGLVAIRHIGNPAEACTLRVAPVSVK